MANTVAIIGMAQALKHLPGQHDQSTHGRIKGVRPSLQRGSAGEQAERERERVAAMEAKFPGVKFSLQPHNPMGVKEAIAAGEGWANLPDAIYPKKDKLPAPVSDAGKVASVLDAWKEYAAPGAGPKFVTFNTLKFGSDLSFQEVFGIVRYLYDSDPRAVSWSVDRSGEPVHVKFDPVRVKAIMAGTTLKHLPGQHDQASHNPHKGSTSQTIPKKDWRSLIPVRTADDANTVLNEMFQSVTVIGVVVDTTLIQLANGAAKLPPEILNRIAQITLHGEEGYKFTAGGQEFQAGGDWDVARSNVNTYNANALTENGYTSLLAHEAGHAVFDEWLDRGRGELLAARKEHAEWFNDDYTVKDEYAQQYKVAAPFAVAYNRWRDAWDAGQDGITLYSTAWAKDGHSGETAAEIGKVYMHHYDFAKRSGGGVTDAEEGFAFEMSATTAPGLGVAFLDVIHALRNVEPLWKEKR